MKYILAVGDGMADEPQAALGGQTPLGYAQTGCLDRLSRAGMVGRTCLIPPGCLPGSLPAQLTLLGCPPSACQAGRAALEAQAQGTLALGEHALRCNLIAVEHGCIAAHDGGGVTAEEAGALFAALFEALSDAAHRFLPGMGYRALLVRRGPQTPGAPSPETLLGVPAAAVLPEDADLRRLYEAGCAVLAEHPVNRARAARGQRPANAVWFWGGGMRPDLPDFTALTGLHGGVAAGVPLPKGIARGMGMTLLPVDQADGSLHTNWEGKAFAAYDGLTRGGLDFVFVHAEAPDEAGHAGSLPEKVAAIEYFSERLIAPLTQWLDADGEAYRLLVLPDHPTPVGLRVHTAGEVPWLLYDSRAPRADGGAYHEAAAARGTFVPGAQMLRLLCGKEQE